MKNFKTILTNALTNKGFNRVEIKEIIKNNKLQLTAVLLFEKGDENITPSIYIDEYFEQYKCGRNLNEIVEEIIDLYEQFRPKFSIDDIFSQMDKKENLRIKVVNAKTNYLEEFIHRVICDGELAEIVISKVDVNNSGYVKQLKDRLPKGIDNEDELFKVAYENTRTECISFKIVEIFKQRPEWEFFPEFVKEEIEKSPMVVISNKDRNHGASCLIHTDFLEEVSQKYFENQNIIVIPSSIHECICLPYGVNMDLEEVKNMVYEVNSTQLEPVEILSNEVFIFDRTTKKLNIAK